jgi:hypothetical protein
MSTSELVGLEKLLTEKELELEAERKNVEAILKECSETKSQPAKDYWHKLHHLTNQVNALKHILDKPL